MPRIRYTDKKLGPPARDIIARANRVITDFQSQGYELTLRQLYYQFVANDLFPDSWINAEYNARNGLPPNTKNTERNYKRLGSIVNDGRLAGLIDWEAIVDRTRSLEDLPHWTSPQNILEVVAEQYRTRRWDNQPRRVEVWIEKDALVGVIEGACNTYDVPYFSCRGYTSQSELWAAGQRLGRYLQKGQAVTVLHLGDHDPSGIDMSRDIADRLEMFITQDWLNDEMELDEGETSVKISDIWRSVAERCGFEDGETLDSNGRRALEIDRIALNWDQIEQYSPPPNPAKVTDSRARGYISIYGRESWELDALEPSVLSALVSDSIEDIIDAGRWGEDTTAMERERESLSDVSNRWAEVEAFLTEAS